MFPKSIRSIVLLALAILAAHVHAAPTECPQHFAGGEAPEFVSQQYTARTTALCFEGHGSMYSGLTKTPFWSAYHLTADKIEAGKHMSRDDAFHAEPKLPRQDRSELKDYSRTGYDKGHLFPNKSASTRAEQYSSFSLSNIAPQVPKHNRGLWSAIEAATRKLAEQRGDLYVITGVIFQGEELLTIGNEVYVPTYFYKAIYDPSRQQGAAYLSPNDATPSYDIVSIAELEALIGINLFPAIPASAKTSIMDLPRPKLRGGR